MSREVTERRKESCGTSQLQPPRSMSDASYSQSVVRPLLPRRNVNAAWNLNDPVGMLSPDSLMGDEEEVIHVKRG